MSWQVDSSARLAASSGEVRLVAEGRGDSKANAMWVEASEADTCAIWRLKVTEGDGIWAGVCTEDRFGAGWALKALLYGGPGNLSDGGSLVKGKWGPKLGKGDSLDMKISVEAERLTVEFGLNGSYLGVAFDIVGWTEAALRPVVSLSGKGDSVTITKLEPSEFPHIRAEVGEEEVSGDWESEDGSYKLSVEGDERLCRLSATVANNIICSLKFNDQRGWSLDGGVISTQMLPSPELQAKERTVTAILKSVTDISRSGGHRFNRAARPTPACRENINWMN